jgi:hypothetical protein
VLSFPEQLVSAVLVLVSLGAGFFAEAIVRATRYEVFLAQFGIVTLTSVAIPRCWWLWAILYASPQATVFFSRATSNDPCLMATVAIVFALSAVCSFAGASVRWMCDM